MLLSSSYSKEAALPLSTCREEVRNTLCTHITGAVCLCFRLLPSLPHSLGWYEQGSVGFDFTEQTLTGPTMFE